MQAKLTLNQKEIVKRMGNGERLIYTSSRTVISHGKSHLYFIGNNPIKESVVESLEKKGIIKINYKKSKESVGYGYITTTDEYELVKKEEGEKMTAPQQTTKNNAYIHKYAKKRQS